MDDSSPSPASEVTPPSKDNTVRNVLLGLAALLTLSICYYILILLPAQSRARLDFDKQKYEEQKAEQKEATERAQEQEADVSRMLAACLADADAAFSDDLKRNGTPAGGGSYNVPTAVLSGIQRTKEAAIEECHRRYK